MSLPPETFIGAKASVKVSLVFVQRFTEADEDAWNGAWASAHAALDPGFAYRRSAVIRSHTVELTEETLPTLAPLLAELAGLEAGRTAPGWRLQDPPAHPRGMSLSFFEQCENCIWPDDAQFTRC